MWNPVAYVVILDILPKRGRDDLDGHIEYGEALHWLEAILCDNGSAHPT